MHNNPQRMELLLETALFMFDEFPSLDIEVFEAAYKALSGLEDKIAICMGDFRQIAPVVPNGDRHATVDASIKSSPLRRLFTVLNLTIHMRLTGLRANISFMTVAEIDDLRFQESFASMLDYMVTEHFHLLLMRITKKVVKIYHCNFLNAYTQNKKHWIFYIHKGLTAS